MTGEPTRRSYYDIFISKVKAPKLRDATDYARFESEREAAERIAKHLDNLPIGTTLTHHDIAMAAGLTKEAVKNLVCRVAGPGNGITVGFGL